MTWVALLLGVLVLILLWRIRDIYGESTDNKRWLAEEQKRSEALRRAFDDQRIVLREKISSHSDLTTKHEVLRQKYDRLTDRDAKGQFKKDGVVPDRDPSALETFAKHIEDDGA